MNKTTTSPPWDGNTKRIIAIIFFLSFISLAWFIRDIFPLVIISALIAFILNPLVTFLTLYVFRASENRGARRGIATLFTFLGTIFALLIGVIVIIPPVVDQFQTFGNAIPGWLRDFETEIETFLQQPLTWNDEVITLDGEPFVPIERLEEATGTRDLTELLQLNAFTIENLQNAFDTFVNSTRSLTGPAFNFLGGAFATTINIVFLLTMIFYLLKDGGIFVDRALGLVPDAYENDARRLVDDLHDVWNAYVRGQLILCVVMGVATYIAALILGLPNAATLGLIAGILEFIPNLGPLIALIPAAFLALVSTSTTIPVLSGIPFMIVVIFVWTGLQNLEAIVLVPRIMGENLDLHPFIVLIAVLGGAAIGGAIGVILAAPFVASGRVIARYIYGKLTAGNPFREESNEPAGEPTVLVKVLVGIGRTFLWVINGMRGLVVRAQRITRKRDRTT